MKKLLLFFVIITSFQSFSQNFNQVEVTGQIVVEGNSVSRVTVYNRTSKVKVNADETGVFKMMVELDDVIRVSAPSYETITFRVSEALMRAKKIKLKLFY